MLCFGRLQLTVIATGFQVNCRICQKDPKTLLHQFFCFAASAVAVFPLPNAAHQTSQWGSPAMLFHLCPSLLKSPPPHCPADCHLMGTLRLRRFPRHCLVARNNRTKKYTDPIFTSCPSTKKITHCNSCYPYCLLNLTVRLLPTAP